MVVVSGQESLAAAALKLIRDDDDVVVEKYEIVAVCLFVAYIKAMVREVFLEIQRITMADYGIAHPVMCWVMVYQQILGLSKVHDL